MSATKNTSLYNQRDDITNKWKVKNVHGMTAENGDIHSFDINKEKENYGLYGYGSADEMYSAYHNDLNFVNRINELDVAKQEQMDAAKKAESQKLQYADTRRTLMEKYIPETLLAQGVANTGYTADALLKAENNYNQYVLGAMNEKANTEQNALKAYQDAYALAQKERDKTAYQDFLDRGQKQTDLFNKALATIEEGGSMDYIKAYLAENGADDATMSKVDKYYNAYVDKARTELYNEYVSKIKEGTLTKTDVDNAERQSMLTPDQANALRETIRKQNVKSGAVTEKKGGVEGTKDLFKVNIGGNKYSLKTSGKVDSTSDVYNMVQDARKEYASAYPKGTIFLYDGKMYVVSANFDDDDHIYEVNSEKRDYDTVAKLLQGG